MSYIDPDLAVAIIVAWTLLRDFFLAPVLVRRNLMRHAQELVEQLFVGLANVLGDPAKKKALEGILAELVPVLRAGVKEAVGRMPSMKEMIGMGIAQKLGLIPGGPSPGPGQGASPGPPSGPASGPQNAQRGPFWRR